MGDKDPLATLTQLPKPKKGEYSRRARSLIPGERANTLPPIIPGEKVFRISPDSKAGRAAVRRWARRHGYDVKPHGKIPQATVDAFMKQNGIWTVHVVHALIPGAKDYAQYYQVMQGVYARKTTVDPDMVRRMLGNELFAMLKQVET